MSDRMIPIGVGIIGLGLVAAAVGAKIAMTPSAPSHDVVTVVAAKPVASVPILLPVPQPQLLVVQAAPPPPLPAPEPTTTTEPRAATPQLDIDCELASYEEIPERCYWDRGFPAISADGKTVAQRLSISHGETDVPWIEVRFIDAETSRVTLRVTVIDPDELEQFPRVAPAVRGAIDRRAARVGAKLSTGGYRSLAAVQKSATDDVAPTGLIADVEEDRVRIVDREANTIVSEHRYAGVSDIRAWWDSTTRTLLTEADWNFGCDTCKPKPIVDYVERLTPIGAGEAAPPPPEPEPQIQPEPRAATPQIDVDCQLAFGSEPPESCSWDHGFPAISADGTTVVVEDTGISGAWLEIRFLSAAASRVIAKRILIDGSEFNNDTEPGPVAHRRDRRRATRVLAELADGRYRSLARVQTPEDDGMSPSGLRADVDGDRVRLIDTAANTVLWEHAYAYEARVQSRTPDPDVTSCVEHVDSIAAWWDAATKTLVTRVSFGDRGEICSDVDVDYVYRL